MTNVHDIEKVKEVLNAEDAEDDLFIYELHHMTAGSEIEFEYAELPEGWTITVKEVNDERDHDSYGNSYTENAYVILAVSNGYNEALYHLPGEYASYEGWTWEVDKLKEVEKTQKVVVVWEWKSVN